MPGAHGLRVLGLGDGTRRLARVPADAPPLEIVRVAVDDRPPPDLNRHVRFLPGRAEIGIGRRGTIVVDEHDGRATFRMARPPTDEEVLHPFLSTVAAVRARWAGRDAFHAGAFLLDGEAWGVLGERGTGKSTLLGALAAEQVPVLSDDLLVVDRSGSAYAGPRFVDLRRSAAERLDLGEHLGRVGARVRWRLELPEVAATAPLRGWIVLRWSRRGPRLERVEPYVRLELLARSLAIGAPPTDPDALLRHVALPMWSLARPRDLGSARGSAGELLELLRGA